MVPQAISDYLDTFAPPPTTNHSLDTIDLSRLYRYNLFMAEEQKPAGTEGTTLPELPTTHEELRELIAAEQRKAFVAFQDRLGNIVSPAIGFQALRQAGKPGVPSVEEEHAELLQDLQGLQSTVTTDLTILKNGGLPPEENRDPRNPAVDLRTETYKNVKTAANNPTPQKT